MERLLQVDREGFEKQAVERAREAIRQIGQVVNGGRTGHVIDDSEMAVKGIGEDLIRQLFGIVKGDTRAYEIDDEITLPCFPDRGQPA